MIVVVVVDTAFVAVANTAFVVVVDTAFGIVVAWIRIEISILISW
jgi:hypothetical protein